MSTSRSSSATLARAWSAGIPYRRSGSAMMSLIGMRGSSDATGSWKTTWMSRRRLRRWQLKDLHQRPRLAAAGFADQAEGFVLGDVEAAPVHRVHGAHGAAEA